MPVTCTDDWHDEDAAEPGAHGIAAGDDTRVDTSILGALPGHDATLTFPAIPAGPVAIVTALPGLPVPPGGFALLPCVSCGKTLTAGEQDAAETFVHWRLWQVAADAGWRMSADAGWRCPPCQVPGTAVVLHPGSMTVRETYEGFRRGLYDQCAEAAERVTGPCEPAARKIATMIADRLRTIQDTLKADPDRPVAAIEAALNHVGDEIAATGEELHSASAARLADLIEHPWTEAAA
jgi:hypothetical protein